MTPKIVEVPTIKKPIQPSPGFEKKNLSEEKLDLCGLCGYGCVYCSSNNGNYLRMRRMLFGDMTEEQLGERIFPSEDPALMFVWPDILDRLREQLKNLPKTWGEGRTLVFSMLTDGFSPRLVADGVTEDALRMIVAQTSLRIRVLTKNAIVGARKWVKFFADHPGRFVVGLSIGTSDDDWAKRIERGTPAPSARVEALRKLQDAGVPTYGMLCPTFAHMLAGRRLEKLIADIRPDQVEHVWAEPFNDRNNWELVRDCMKPGSIDHAWLTDVFDVKKPGAWSSFAAELYLRLKAVAVRDGWLHKLRYLLYEGDIVEADAPKFAGLKGVLLQSKPADDGRSQNPYIAALQAKPSRRAREVVSSH